MTPSGGGPFGLAVVGYGDIARRIHGPLLAERSDLFQVRAVCDPDGPARARAAQDWPCARVAPTVDALDLEDVDAALVLTSDGHAGPVRTLLAARRPMLVEKPLCFEPSTGAELSGLAAGTGVPVMVGYMKRYSPAVTALLGRLGELGELTRVEATLSHPLPPVRRTGGVDRSEFVRGLDEAIAGYGLPAALAADCTPSRPSELRAYFLTVTSVIHLLNLTRAILGPGAAVTSGRIDDDGLGGELQLAASGCEARVRWAFRADGPFHEAATITGSGGRARTEFTSVYASDGAVTRAECSIDGRTELWCSPGLGFREEHVSFFEVVRGHSEPVTDAAQGVEDLRAAVAALALAGQRAP